MAPARRLFATTCTSTTCGPRLLARMVRLHHPPGARHGLEKCQRSRDCLRPAILRTECGLYSRKRSQLGTITTHLGWARAAFYAILSLAPLLVLLIRMAAAIFGHSAAQDQIIATVGQNGRGGWRECRSWSSGARFNSRRPERWPPYLACSHTAVRASGVFGELRSALNVMWDVRPENAGVLENHPRAVFFLRRWY